MATANFTPKAEVEFIQIPYFHMGRAGFESSHQEFQSYAPVVLMPGEWDADARMQIGKSMSYPPVPSREEAFDIAKAKCLETEASIGFTTRGIP